MVMITRRGVAAVLGLAAIPALANAPRADGALARIEASAGGRLGVAVIDEAGEVLAAHRAEERFLFCSSFKVFLAGAVLESVDGGRERLDRTIKLSSSDALQHSPIIEKALPAGETTIEALCAGTVRLSDNGAANLLLDRIGGPTGLTGFLARLGGGGARLDRREPALNIRDSDKDTVTPAQAAAMLRRLLSRDVLREPTRDLLERWLVESPTGAKRLRAGIPSGWRAGDKTGTGPSGETNDIGFLDPPGRGRLFVAAYYEGADRSLHDREAVLADVGRAAAQLVGGS